MATRALLSRSRPLQRLLPLLSRPSSAGASIANIADIPDVDVIPPLLPYDRISLEVQSRLRRLDSPDPRFLRYASPHPIPSPDQSSILALPSTRVTTLRSGLRVATETDLSASTATVGVWIAAGSRFETDETCGITHFLSHMIFKRSRLAEEIENIGGHLNVYTSREQTAYYAKVMGKDVGKAVEILADSLLYYKFDPARVERERGVVLREMEEVETEEVIFDHLHATAFQYTPLGRTSLGPAANVERITQDDLRDYIYTHYTAPRMVISAAGAVKHEELVKLVENFFRNLTDYPVTASQLVQKYPSNFTGSEVRMVDDYAPLAQFAVAFSGASWTDPDSIALMVMQTMLGSWNKNMSGGKHMGSDLVQKVAVNEIAESIKAFNTNYNDAGLFGVYALAKPDCLDDLAFAIMSELSKLSYRVSDADLIRARNQLKSSLQLHIDGTSDVAEDIGRQLLTYGRRIPAAELFARIDAVDASTVKRVAGRFIFDQDIAIAAMGPIKKLPDYNWFRRRTYLNRY